MKSRRAKPAAPANVGAAPRFQLGAAIARENDVHASPYDPRHEPPPAVAARAGLPAPTLRRLSVYARDPSTSRMEIATASTVVPWEPLRPGPCGRVIRVVDFDSSLGVTYDALDLDAMAPGAERGLRPTTTDPRFAQQMTYGLAAATYERFRKALGRNPDFAFPEHPEDRGDTDVRSVRLHIHPHGMREDNAYYDRDQGALLFGYTRAGKQARGQDQAGALVFTSLSHDVVVHETSHALLDGIRPKLLLPSNPDVDAFHEGFADVVALFQKFQFEELVLQAITEAPVTLDARILIDFARQFGAATGDGTSPLRSALLEAGDLDEPVAAKFRYASRSEAHDRGAVLVAAIFDAFRWVYQRKTEKLRALAPPRPARLPHALIELLATEVMHLAEQFLNIVIRALDYCPPVDLTFGGYLRALITADHDLVAEDPWCYREALVRGFRRYGITVPGVPDLTEDALLWRPPERDLGVIDGLAHDKLSQPFEPGRMPDGDELTRRAVAVGEFVTDPMNGWYFGLAPAGRRDGRAIERPIVESVRTLRRASPDGDINVDLVAEVTQRRRVSARHWFYGGATIILGGDGRVRYAICKNVLSERREDEFRAHLAAMPEERRRFFGDAPPPVVTLLKSMHAYRGVNAKQS